MSGVLKRRLSLPMRLLAACAALLFGLFVVTLGCVVVVFGNPFDTNPFDDIAYDSRMWKEDASCSDRGNRRGRMADDLLRHRLKAGMTQVQVQALLGPPGHVLHKHEASQWPLRFRKEDGEAELLVEYFAGQDLLPHNYYTWIDLFFDKRGRYVKGRISSPPDDWRVILPE